MAEREAETAGHGPAPAPHTRPHPGPREYVKIAIILAVITALEVGLYYIEVPDGPLIALLVVFSGLKFALVALWFMHLRFDAPILKRLFVTGLVLAAAVYAIVLIITMFNRSGGSVVGAG